MHCKCISSSSDQQLAKKLLADHETVCTCMCLFFCVYTMLAGNNVMLCIMLQASCTSRTLHSVTTVVIITVLLAVLDTCTAYSTITAMIISHFYQHCRRHHCPFTVTVTTNSTGTIIPFPLWSCLPCCRYRGLSAGRSHRACVDALSASCQGLTHICPLCHGSITVRGDALLPCQSPGVPLFPMCIPKWVSP